MNCSAGADVADVVGVDVASSSAAGVDVVACAAAGSADEDAKVGFNSS